MLDVSTGGQFSSSDVARFTDGWFTDESSGGATIGGDFLVRVLPRDVFAARIERFKATVEETAFGLRTNP